MSLLWNYRNPTIHTGNHFDGSDVFQNFREVSGLFRLEHTFELDLMYTHGLSELKAQCPELSTHSALLLVFVRVCQIRKRVSQPIYLELAMSSHSSFFFCRSWSNEKKWNPRWEFFLLNWTSTSHTKTKGVRVKANSLDRYPVNLPSSLEIELNSHNFATYVPKRQTNVFRNFA